MTGRRAPIELLRPIFFSVASICVMHACAGGNPAGPSEPGQGDIPADAHVVRNSAVTVFFGYEFDPPKGTSGMAGREFSIRMWCRSTANLRGDLALIYQHEFVNSSNSPFRDIQLSFLRGPSFVTVEACYPPPDRTQAVRGATRFSEPFNGLREIRISAWLDRGVIDLGPNPGPTPTPSRPPDYVGVEVVNWTR